MSAQVSPEAWGWWCAECGDGSEITFDSEHIAERDARIHDEEQHG